MVAVVKTGHSIGRLLNYNEQKVSEGVARLLCAENYPIDAEQMGFSQKLNRLLKQAALNENVKRNSVHISLNFHPSEVLSDERMQEIANEYMAGIGFADQPYLIYRHMDAGHPHLHLVSVKVRADGSRVDTQNIGRNQSRKMCVELEKKHGLVVSKGAGELQNNWLKPVNPQRAAYGKTQTKRAMANVLLTVLNDYRFASLPELNAVLKSFNMVADRGSEDSRIFQNKGLVYRVLDERGERVGVPVKASDFYFNPGLKDLEKRFASCLKTDEQRKRLRGKIDWALLKPGLSLQELMLGLKAEGIDVIIRQNNEGVVYGLTYVDHINKAVFNGSDLGKGYSAKSVLERLVYGKVQNRSIGQAGEEKEQAGGQKARRQNGSPGRENGNILWQVNDGGLPSLKGFTDTLLEAGYETERMDGELRRIRKKKKRLRQSPG